MSHALPDILAAKLSGLRPSGDGWSARCPAHDDRTPSLSVSVDDDGRVLVCCHAGCDTNAVLDAVGLTWADLRPSSNGDEHWTPAGPAIATYVYTDAHGKVICGVCRTAGKQFPQWKPDPSAKTGRSWSVRGLTQPLYRLPNVLAAISAGQTVYVVEGEKDVHALEGVGVTATCNPGGAGKGKWKRHHTASLRNAVVTVVADNDDPGRKHARAVAEALAGEATSVRLVRAAAGKDAADHLAAGHDVDDFRPPRRRRRNCFPLFSPRFVCNRATTAG